jgi:hypothetical protein
VLQNLIPVLMERPQRVFLVVTAEMARRRADQRLRRQLRQADTEVIDCGDCPDADFTRIQAYAHQIAEQVINAGADAEIVLNATGGNKLMSIAFVEAFRGIASRILYTDTAHRRIEYLPAARGSQAPPPTPMSDVLDVPGYLRAQGFHFRAAASDGADWREHASARKAASKFLGRHIGDAHLQSFVGSLNKLADMALERLPNSYEERLAAPEQSLTTAPWGRWAEALDALTQADILDWTPGSKDLRFRDADAARFARGGWLEEYAYHVVHDAGVHDIRLGVAGVWDNEQAMANEFDVLACHLNQLLFIECKTLRYRDQNDNQIAYKLDSLGEDARGLFGRTWLLSAREPTDTLVARARRARIRLVPPVELQRLRELVREWRG